MGRNRTNKNQGWRGSGGMSNLDKIFWDIWSENFHNARRFFNSKGNIKTKSKLKTKWLNDLKSSCELLIEEVRK